MSSQSSATEISRQIVTQFYESLAAGKFEEVMACLHPDVEIHEPDCLPYGGVYRGHDGVQELFSQALKYLDVSVFKIEAIVADGDRVVGFIHTAVAGSRASALVAEESLIRDGKIARVRVFQFDPTLLGKK